MQTVATIGLDIAKSVFQVHGYAPRIGGPLAPSAKILRRYYNASRIHRSLSKDAPFPRAIERLGVITSQPVLGDLHHQYCRI
jgi:hypothetical protein